ncbi:MAG: aldehyde dehydrogenase [Candidatus Merdivicinus sp.]|jgi:aldehyde dehydrogenase (NAD+)
MKSNEEMLFAQQKAYFRSGETRRLPFRKEQLKKLLSGLKCWEKPLLDALAADLGKSPFEGYATEIGLIREEVRIACRCLGKWAKIRRTAGPLTQFPSSGALIPEPKGCTLILAPWNYPVQLILAPLVSAIAAGNCAMLALPEDAPRTSAVLAEMLGSLYPETYIAARFGSIEGNTRLLALPFDHIFFTGSPRVGRIVMAAAAKNLTPVTLELGGKSPCIVDKTADIVLAARRIAWGKCLNAGQTCVAPDYLFVQESVQADFLRELEKQASRLYPGGMNGGEDYPRIVNRKHFDRLSGLMEGQRILFGGEKDSERLQISLAALDSPAPDSPVMQEEIFGPLLPVIPYRDIEEVLEFVLDRPKPLALYVFTRDRALSRRIFREVSFGGGCLNDTIVHLTSHSLPFGGVGESGMGSCHGKAGFDAFTHLKPVLRRGTWLDLPVRYPPYRGKLGLLKKLMR